MDKNFKSCGRLMFAHVNHADMTGVPPSAISPCALTGKGSCRLAFQDNAPSGSHEVLGIDPVLHAAQQILDFSCACLRRCIIERHRATESELRMLQPGSCLLDITEEVCRLAQQPRIPNNFV